METHFIFVGNVTAHLVALMSGIASFVIATVQAIRKRPLSEKIFWAIGAICLVIAFDQAWQDEHKNAEILIKQKSTLAADYGTCNTDLKIANEQVRFFQDQAKTDSTNFNVQQSTLNGCVVALGRANAPAPLLISSKGVRLNDIQSEAGEHTVLGIVIAETNKQVLSLRGAMKCDSPFRIHQASLLISNSVYQRTAFSQTLSKEVELDFGHLSWAPGQYLVFEVSGPDLVTAGCSFSLHS